MYHIEIQKKNERKKMSGGLFFFTFLLRGAPGNPELPRFGYRKMAFQSFRRPGSPRLFLISDCLFLRHFHDIFLPIFSAFFRRLQNRPVYEKSSIFSWRFCTDVNAEKALFFKGNANPENQKTGNNPRDQTDTVFGPFSIFAKRLLFILSRFSPSGIS